jgi:hypothetical protein
VSRASELVARLQELSKLAKTHSPTLPRTGQDIVPEQLPVFGELLVVLAADLDRAQKKIELLTWVIAGLTAVLVVDAVVRLFTGH